MSEIKIKCPTCGKILIIEDKPNIDKASFACPVCNGKHVVGNCQRYAPHPFDPSDDKTRYPGSPSSGNDGERTRVFCEATAKAGMLVDANGTSYPLAIGTNTIGRKSSSSTASTVSVQIQTDDRTMSRHHAIIEVRNEGGQLIHILKNWENKNPSYINNALIAPGDQLILNDGDSIKMAATKLTFKKQ